MGAENSVADGWWRWPLVPLGAVFGGLAASAFFYALQWFAMKMQGGFSEDGWWFLYIMPVMQAAVMGWAFTQSAAHIAPRGKFISAVVMVTLLLALFLGVLVFGWASPKVSVGTAVQATIGTVATAIACIVTLVQIREEEGG